MSRDPIVKGLRHTIEAVPKLSTRLQLGAMDLLTWKEPVQDQTEQVVTQSSDESLGVEKTGEARPSHLFLQLVQFKAVGME